MAFPTNPIYKLYNDPMTRKLGGIQKAFPGSNQRFCIPINEENTDYQEYLEWVAEGNTAEAAD